MKMFYCNGKKDFCENVSLCNSCEYADESGGEYRDKPKTNADRIRAMNDEELADFLVGLADDGNLKIREWLQQSAEDAARKTEILAEAERR